MSALLGRVQHAAGVLQKTSLLGQAAPAVLYASARGFAAEAEAGGIPVEVQTRVCSRPGLARLSDR